jgi:GTP cyclohydrolase II
MVKSQSFSSIIDSVERAIAELRRGQPVVITDGKKELIVSSVEAQSPKRGKVQVVVTGARVGKKGKAYLATIDATKLASFVGLTPPSSSRRRPGSTTGSKMDPGLRRDDELSLAALQLMKAAELLPACIVLKKSDTPIKVSVKAIAQYEEAVAYSLQEVCRAPLQLKHAGKAEIIGFRPASGGKEHYAIIVGKGLKSKAPLIRIHSSCYTGDLLDSLACDCGDQLHTALHKMQEEGGGIVLYLMQEGRGIGLVNKLRTYQLQEQGMDTVEANQTLGFDDDERLFLPAAEILKRLKIKRVRLLTNNPRKVSELERLGIKVEARVPHVMHAGSHRAGYMGTKSRKMGHIL